MHKFYSYVHSFYGPGGLYPMGVAFAHIQKATAIYLSRASADFCGDSVDREAVRDILIEDFGYKWPD